jgi:hypothetical protein
MFKTLLIAAAGAALIAGSASAQSYAPPMDMSWAFTSQAQNDANGRAMVNFYQAQILAALQAARDEGHPFNGVILPQNNPNTFVPNNNGTATINAIEGWDLQAIRDCARHDQYGHTWYVC